MKKKEIKNLRLKTAKELNSLVDKTYLEIVKLRADQKVGKLRNVHQLTQARHNLARIKTILKEMEPHEAI